MHAHHPVEARQGGQEWRDAREHRGSPEGTPRPPTQSAVIPATGGVLATDQRGSIAFARSPAAELAPFTYSEIVAGIGIGFVIFGSLPSLLSWFGIAIVILSGVLVARSQMAR